MANRILKSTPSARWITTKQDKDLKTFSNEPLKVLCQIATRVIHNDWAVEDACITNSSLGEIFSTVSDLQGCNNKQKRVNALSLDSEVINKSIHKNNYQMPKIEKLIDSISQHLTNTHNGQHQLIFKNAISQKRKSNGSALKIPRRLYQHLKIKPQLF